MKLKLKCRTLLQGLCMQGNVFKACGQEEAVALLEGNADYEGAAGDGNFNGSKRQVTENLLQ